MTAKRSERIFGGQSAAPGFAVGPAYRLARGDLLQDREIGNAVEERVLIDKAITEATKQLEALSQLSGELGSEILEFQIALLEDEDLLAPVFAAIEGGAGADDAWNGVLNGEIADYASAEDEYMAARAADLTDLRDRVLRILTGGDHGDDVADGSVVVAENLTPSQFLGIDWSKVSGAVLLAGSATSHVAILARSHGVPLIVELGLEAAIDAGDVLAVDATNGNVFVNPDAATLAQFDEKRAAEKLLDARAEELLFRPAVTADGRPVRVLINVNEVSELDDVSPDICDGIGLTRTEFLFSEGAPDEELQYAVYAQIVNWAKGRPVTIRTLDAGGDKPLPGITVDGEINPFLGIRGLRLSLMRRDLFKVQLRALARAAFLGPLKVMVPMVSIPEELEETRTLLAECVAELQLEGTDCGEPELGMMVEVPAAALTANEFDAAFYSIGSNDLIQYTMAVARDASGLSYLSDGSNPAVIELIGRTVAAGKARGVEVSLCGEMASRPEHIDTLMDAGLETFSVAPARIAQVKLAISMAGHRAA